MTLGVGLNRAKASVTDPPSSLEWTSRVLDEDLDTVGDLELDLDAIATASDLAWIVTLSDVAPNGTTEPVTAGYLRASLRAIDDAASRPGAPVVPCRTAEAVPAGESVRYRIPLVPNARRFAAGHRLRLTLVGDDQPAGTVARTCCRPFSIGHSSSPGSTRTGPLADGLAASAPKHYSELSCPKQLITFKAGDGAGDHCELGARQDYLARSLDWLDNLLHAERNRD